MIWTDKRISCAIHELARHYDDADNDWTWQSVYVLSLADAEDVTRQVRNEYETELASLRRKIETFLALVERLLDEAQEDGNFYVVLTRTRSRHAFMNRLRQELEEL